MSGQRKIAVIGLVGGVASGKSLVAGQLSAKGAAVIDADRAGHEVLRMPEVIAAARERWGDQIIDAHGQVDRRALAKIVFAPPPAGPRELVCLEQLTHARIGERLRWQIDGILAAGSAAAIVLDAPVLLKAGWDRFCDWIVLVDAPAEIRAARAAGRGWSRADLELREAAQESLDAKRAAADLVIDNSGSPDATAAQIDLAWPALSGSRQSCHKRP